MLGSSPGVRLRARALLALFTRLRALVAPLPALALAATLAACGGGHDAGPNDTEAAAGTTTVAGADGASVRYRPLAGGSAAQATVRVARDGSGAPPLPAGAVPAGGIYQFTPLGLAAPGLEVRVPFDTAAVPAGHQPRLHIALPGVGWADVPAARREGAFMVAQVPHLAHATVLAQPGVAGKSPAGREAAQAFAVGSAAFSIVPGPGTTPALPPADAIGIHTLTQRTQLALNARYDLPAACQGRGFVQVLSLHVPADGSAPTSRTLAARPVAGSGNLALQQDLAGNGFWTFYGYAACTNLAGVWMAVAPAFVVKLQPDALPVIGQAPTDVNVVDGDTAQFTVAATGTGLLYGWERSGDGGQTYVAVPNAAGASLVFTATRADDGSLWRAVVRNAAGTVTSASARLSVAERVIAPAITTDPASQTVTEGETASFSVAGSGQPAPALQWQTRSAADAAQANAEAGWADLPGATASTYTTAATTLAQSGSQLRAVLANAGGRAASLPATLTVRAKVVAPAITSGPQSQTVPAGQLGLFSVAASGTSPLSYQWFRNGQPIIGANATEVLVLAEAGDIGSSYAISVQVSNAAGSVTSAPAAMNIVAPADTGTLINAATGGTVSGASGESLVIPAGALTQDTRISLQTTPLDANLVPPGAIAITGLIDIRPAGLSFAAPVELNIPAPSDIPPDMTIAVLRLQDGAQPFATTRTVQVPAKGLNLRRAAKMGKTIVAPPMRTAAFFPSTFNCGNIQNITSSGRFGSMLASAGQYGGFLVNTSQCASIDPRTPPNGAPSDTDQPCREESDFVTVSGLGDEAERSLVSRHVDCRGARSGSVELEVDLKPGLTPGSWFYLGPLDTAPAGARTYTVGTVARFDTQFSVSGPSNRPAKEVRMKVRALGFSPNLLYPGPDKTPGVRVQLVLTCTGRDDPLARCVADAGEVSVPLNGNWSAEVIVPVSFIWSGPNPQGLDMETFRLSVQRYNVAVGPSPMARPRSFDATGTPFNFDPNVGSLPEIRCDRGVAHATSSGCVFTQAAPVYVLKTSDLAVSEAAEHVREAQANGSPGRFALKAGTRALVDGSAAGPGLQRFKNADEYRNPNREAACIAVDALIKIRPTYASRSCSPTAPGCECDEYPFNSTFQGAAYDPSNTSVKWINAKQNQNSGTGFLSTWYVRQRVLDLADRPRDGVTPPVNGGESDAFWVHVPLAD